MHLSCHTPALVTCPPSPMVNRETAVPFQSECSGKLTCSAPRLPCVKPLTDIRAPHVLQVAERTHPGKSERVIDRGRSDQVLQTAPFETATMTESGKVGGSLPWHGRCGNARRPWWWSSHVASRPVSRCCFVLSACSWTHVASLSEADSPCGRSVQAGQYLPNVPVLQGHAGEHLGVDLDRKVRPNVPLPGRQYRKPLLQSLWASQFEPMHRHASLKSSSAKLVDWGQ